MFLMIVVLLFLTVSWVRLQFVIAVFPAIFNVRLISHVIKHVFFRFVVYLFFIDISC